MTDIDEMCHVHSAPTETNAEKMAAVKDAIKWYEEHDLDWVSIVTYLIAWDKSSKACPFCGRRSL